MNKISIINWFFLIAVLIVSYPKSSLGQDTTPPSISSSIPDNNDTGLSIRNTNDITINFSENVVEPTSITITPNITFTTEFILAQANQLKIIFESGNLAFNTEYTISLTGVTDLADTPNTANLNISFTTGSAVSVNNALTENICVGDPDGKELEPIVITENLADNFVNLASPVEVLSLRLVAPNGFVFTNKGSASNTSTETTKDLVVIDTRLIDSNKSLVIDYKLCDNPPNCTTESTVASDVITLTGVEIAAPDASLVASGTYAITRSSINTGGNNDAVMPGLGPNVIKLV